MRASKFWHGSSLRYATRGGRWIPDLGIRDSSRHSLVNNSDLRQYLPFQWQFGVPVSGTSLLSRCWRPNIDGSGRRRRYWPNSDITDGSNRSSPATNRNRKVWRLRLRFKSERKSSKLLLTFTLVLGKSRPTRPNSMRKSLPDDIETSKPPVLSDAHSPDLDLQTAYTHSMKSLDQEIRGRLGLAQL